MAYISDAIRHEIMSRAKRRCEYCQTQQFIVITMEIDHIVPESADGKTELDNLCYACISCNGSKLNSQTGTDPETDKSAPLYNPRKHSWLEHFQWSNDKTQILGLTSIGRATVARLRMNRDIIVQSRKRWVEVGWHPPSED